ncbi:MAG: methyltransferase domain-containing protein [Anaerolineae bacterium]|nr:methyltransferase domain-containing protein [Anaerolineae bacterium]
MKTLSSIWWGLIRFGFRLLYNELAWTYDLVSRIVSLGQWHDWQKTALKHIDAAPGEPILELAHGTAVFHHDLIEAGYMTIGLDRSPYMGRIARRRLKKSGVNPLLVRADAKSIPLPPESVSTVVSTFPTEFIVHPKTLHEIRRVLTPDGRLIVVFNGILTSKRPSAEALEWLYRITGQRGPWPGDIEDQIKKAGFTLRLVTENLDRSQVLLFIATKQAASQEQENDRKGRKDR